MAVVPLPASALNPPLPHRRGQRRRWSPEDRARMAAEYPAKSIIQLAVEWDTTPSTVARALAAMGRPRRSAKEAADACAARRGEKDRAYSDAQERQIVAERRAGHSCAGLAARWGCNRSSIRHILARRGYDTSKRDRSPYSAEDTVRLLGVNEDGAAAAGRRRQSRGEKKAARQAAGPRSNRYYRLNEQFFSRPVTSPAVAYVAGFVAGDGCVADAGVVSVAISRADEDILFKIREALGADYPVRYLQRINAAGKLTDLAAVAFCSKSLAADLVALGVGPRKTFDLGPWQGPPELAAAFYLGLFDADGYWGRAEKESGAIIWSMGWTGAAGAMEGVARFVERLTGKYVSPRPHGSIWKVHYSGLNLVRQIANAMYADAPMWLDRKRATAEEMLAYRPRHRDWRLVGKDWLLTMKDDLGTWTAVAAALGTSPSNLSAALRRLGIRK